jgi:CheY-like chemotaxis protein
VALVTRLDPALGSVKADAGQLEQVIMNLAVNARDAMPGGGTLTIETRNVEIGGAAAGAPESVVPPGGYVLLRVADTGTGMDAGTRAHIFEPFFTTKEPGKGTGLGLATVYGIVKQSGGFVFVDSEPGRGAAFRIYLSRLTEPVAAGPVEPLPPRSVAGTETVLLVEDEEAVRAVAGQSLRRLGYTVLEARNGESAVQVAAAAPGAIAILVTDVVMPGMNGRALAERLRAGHPGLKVLFVSGYADNAVLRDGVLEPGLSFLQKPFTPEVLARKVREVLDG